LVEAQEQLVREEGGLLPVRVVEGLTQDDHARLSDVLDAKGKLPAPRALHERYDIKPLNMAKWRDDIGYVTDEHIVQVGPLLSACVIYHPKDMTTKTASAAVRCVQPGDWYINKPPEEQPPDVVSQGWDVPRIARFRKEISAKLKRYTSVCKATVFSAKNIARFVSQMPFICELKNGKMSRERFLELLGDMRKATGLPSLKGNIKLEITSKPGKSGRIVIDCSLERTVVETVVAYVFDHMLFEHCRDISIKGQSRAEVLDQISVEFSKPIPGLRNPVIPELDQTGFDGHNRTYPSAPGKDERVGVFASLMSVYHHVATCISRTSNECWSSFTVHVGDQDTKGRAYLKFAGHGSTWKALILLLYMLSGRKITSSGNFWAELFLALAAYVDDPAQIWLHDLSTFDFKWIVKAIGKTPLYYRPRLEGDDVLARQDGRLQSAERREYAKRFFLETGFEAKLVFAVGTKDKPARAEFVGVHFVVVNGATIPKLWVPAVARGLISSGGYCAKAATPPTQVQGHIALSLLSRAIGFAGRCEPAARYLFALAAEHQAQWMREIAPTLRGEVTLDGYHAEARGIEGKGYAALSEMYAELVSKSLPLSEQLLLLATSVEKDISNSDFARWNASAAACTPSTPAYDVLAQMPTPLIEVFGKTLVS